MRPIDVAKRYLGLNEKKDTQTLRDFFKSEAIGGDIDINPAKVSWCSAFMNACQREVGNKGTGSLLAQSWKKYGQEVKPEDIKEGDILVFHFPTDLDWQGHVTFFQRKDGSSYVCLGGNQRDSVNLSSYSMKYCIAIRRPV